MINSSFSSNKANFKGGIYLATNNTIKLFANNICNNNSVLSDGGVIYISTKNMIE